ncbi:MAG: sulfotransferase [Bacteroidota bacterium]
MNESGFNFIVGIGRSGTTLLMSMLNAHPSIQSTPEVNFYVFFYNAWKNKTTFVESDFEKVERYVQIFKRRKHSSGFDWSMDLFREHIKKHNAINFAVIYRCFYRSFVYAGVVKEVTHNFDKNPINTLFLDDIVNALPDAKFVYLVRDPRANYLSRKEKTKARPADIYLDPQRWALYNEAAIKVVEKYKDRFLILKYEDLVSDPESCLNKLAAFFNFKYDQNMLNFHSDVKEINLKNAINKPVASHPQAKEKYEKLSRPVNTDRLQVWKSRLTQQEIDVVSFICRIAEKLNYDVIKNRPSLNLFKFYKGRWLAKLNLFKEKVIYRLPLDIKLKLAKPV